MQLPTNSRKLRGRVTLSKDGVLLFERDNLVVNTGLVALANLLGGTTAGEFVAVVGFGSGNTPVTASDTALNTDPRYYNAVGAISIGPAGGVASGSVLFNYQLLTTDYAANPITIQELGLFGNTGGATFPAATGTSNPSIATAISNALRQSQVLVLPAAAVIRRGRPRLEIQSPTTQALIKSCGL